MRRRSPSGSPCRARRRPSSTSCARAGAGSSRSARRRRGPSSRRPTRTARCTPRPGWTEVVISPDRPARVVDGLVTGWHNPDASHLLLVESVAGAGPDAARLRRGGRAPLRLARVRRRRPLPPAPLSPRATTSGRRSRSITECRSPRPGWARHERGGRMPACTSSSPPTATPAPSRRPRPPTRWPTAGPARPRTTAHPVPLSDGGPGFVDVLAGPRTARCTPSSPTDPLGRDVPGHVLLRPARAAARPTSSRRRRPGCTCSPPTSATPRVRRPSGSAPLLAALEAGARRIVIGLGGLGHERRAAPACSPRSGRRARRRGSAGAARPSPATTADDLAGLDAARDRLRRRRPRHRERRRLAAARPQGCQRRLRAEQKGATGGGAQRLENALGHFARRRPRAAAGRDLLTGPAQPEREPGAGAAGGLGFALLLLGAPACPGSRPCSTRSASRDLVARPTSWSPARARFDWQSLRGKVVVRVAAGAASVGVPVIAIAGQVARGSARGAGHRPLGRYAVAERPRPVAAALADPAGTPGRPRRAGRADLVAPPRPDRLQRCRRLDQR